MLDIQYGNNPERFVRGRPIVPLPPDTVAINPITETEDGQVLDDSVNFPTLTAAGYVKYMLYLNNCPYEAGIFRITASTTSNYSYDIINRLKTYTGPSNTAIYTYDPNGRRIKKNVNGANTTWFLWDGTQIMAEYDGAGVRKQRYAYLPNDLAPSALQVRWYQLAVELDASIAAIPDLRHFDRYLAHISLDSSFIQANNYCLPRLVYQRPLNPRTAEVEKLPLSLSRHSINHLLFVLIMPPRDFLLAFSVKQYYYLSCAVSPVGWLFEEDQSTRYTTF